jgi:hypothetical protein
VRWLLRQLSFFGFKVTATKTASTGSETTDVACLLGFAPTVLIMAYVGGLSEGANGVAQDFAANTVGRIKKEYQERDWIVLRNLSSGLLLRDLVEKEKLQFVRHTCRSPK